MNGHTTIILLHKWMTASRSVLFPAIQRFWTICCFKYCTTIQLLYEALYLHQISSFLSITNEIHHLAQLCELCHFVIEESINLNNKNCVNMKYGFATLISFVCCYFTMSFIIHLVEHKLNICFYFDGTLSSTTPCPTSRLWP